MDHCAVRGPQVGDTAAALGLDWRGKEDGECSKVDFATDEEHLPRLKDYAGYKKGDILERFAGDGAFYGTNKNTMGPTSIHEDIIKALPGIFKILGMEAGVSKAYGAYDRDPRVNGPFDFDAFAQAILDNMPAN